VRISTQKTFNGGLFIADFWAMPHGCSVWPAWWSVGPNWPNGGEIDVIEGINTASTNQYTLHTGPGCTMNNAKKRSSDAFTGMPLGNQCQSGNNDNNGCAIADADHTSYGHGFNLLAGGVYAHIWDSTGIKIWHFPRNSVPADIEARTPNPDSWPAPNAAFSSANCDMASHFQDHVLTFDITLCGDWAGNAYSSVVGCSGTCADAVADPQNFKCEFALLVVNYFPDGAKTQTRNGKSITSLCTSRQAFHCIYTLLSRHT
jgi:hypothetical protein